VILPCPVAAVALPTGIGGCEINVVDAPVDCYFPFHFVLIPPVLVGHLLLLSRCPTVMWQLLHPHRLIVYW